MTFYYVNGNQFLLLAILDVHSLHFSMDFTSTFVEGNEFSFNEIISIFFICILRSQKYEPNLAVEYLLTINKYKTIFACVFRYCGNKRRSELIERYDRKIDKWELYHL